MRINKEEVLNVAHLSRLNIDDDAVDAFAAQINRILDYIDQLNQVDTQGVPPTSHAISLANAFREDDECPHLDRSAALANAPEKSDSDFIVPRVIG